MSSNQPQDHGSNIVSSPPISDQSPSISDQSPSISDQSPSISDQSPSISDQSPSISDQSPPEKSTTDMPNQENSESASPPQKPKRTSIVSLQGNPAPVYYIVGGNNNTLVDVPLSNLGWKRSMEKTDDFRLKWTECKSHINFNTFKEGEQMVNHIPNGSSMTNKLGLYNSLKEYDRAMSNTRKRYTGMLMNEFFPETYNLDDRQDRENFLELYKDGEIWICKPSGLNQGKGIYLVRSLEEVNKTLSEREEKQTQNVSKRLMGRILQRYLPMPLLLDNKKFDVRIYMAITSTVPYMVFYHTGYCRLSVQEYSKDSEDMKIHLTNQYIQKRDPNYKEVKDETVWSMDRLNNYINENVAPDQGLVGNWVNTIFLKQTQKIMQHLFKAVKNKLGQKVGFFEIYGLDFMIDSDMKIYLIEVNVNPSLATNCDVLRDVIPPVVEEFLKISIESFDKSRKNQCILPLKNLSSFTALHMEKDTRSRNSSPVRRGSQASPTRQKRASYSPTKEGPESRKSSIISPFARPVSLPPKNPKPTTNNAYSSRRPLATSTTRVVMETSDKQDDKKSDQVKLKMTRNTGIVTNNSDKSGSSTVRKTSTSGCGSNSRGN